MHQRGKQRHEEHIADVGHDSVSLYNLVHLPIPIPEAVTCQKQKRQRTRDETNSKECQLGRIQRRNKQEVIEEAQKESETVHFCDHYCASDTIDDQRSLNTTTS